MGRQKGYEGRQFKDLKVKCNRSQTWHQCLHCLAANGNDGSKVPKIRGNSVVFLRHLLQCPYAPRDFRRPIDQEQQTNSSDATMATSQLLNANLDEHPSGSLSISQREWMITKLVEFQAQCFLPDSFIESRATLDFLESINAAVLKYLPKRRQLGGPILGKCASAIQEESTDGMLALQAKTGGRATFLNDVWQNITKNHLMGCLMALFGHYVSLGLFPTGPRHDAIALAQLMEKVMRDAELNGWVIGAVVTDDAGQCGRARRILSLRWPHVVFLKCFAHDINNLVKAVLRTSSFREITTQATEIVNALHASSSKWLVLAKESMNQTYGRERHFIRLCDTRWNSMQGCFASLLRVKTALRVFATKYRNDKTFPDALTCLEDPVFWQKLRDVEIAVNPLCFASFKLQSDENTLADVVIVFRDLFDGFIAGNYSSDMISLLESRWRACEQPLFILALYLHPAYVDTRLALPSNTDLTNFDNIGKFAKLYYQKLLRGDPGSIIGEMDEWLDGDFTDLTLDDFQDVSLPPLPAFWRSVKKKRPQTRLADLAIALFSISVNTATCERYFSDLALIHTPHRNCMTPAKAAKISGIRKHLRDKNPSKKPKSPYERIVSPEELDTIAPYGTPSRRRSSSRRITPFVRTSGAEKPDEQRHEGIDEDPEEEDEGVASSDPLKHWDAIFTWLESCEEEWNRVPNEATESVQMSNDESDILYEASEDEETQMPPFPDTNDPHFPQEDIELKGLRGKKATLDELFMLSSSTASVVTRLHF